LIACNTEQSKSQSYWNESVPWNFKNEKLTYEQRRKLRYDLQDYMPDNIPFKEWARKNVLELVAALESIRQSLPGMARLSLLYISLMNQ